MSANNQQPGYVSPELDAMTCDAIGQALEALAEGDIPGVMVLVEDAAGARQSVAFSDDGDEACLEAAAAYVSRLAGEDAGSEGIGPVVRYAVQYLGCVQDEAGAYIDALITSFGEKGSPTGYSAYTLVDGIGAGDSFMWSDPEPAGEEPLLV